MPLRVRVVKRRRYRRRNAVIYRTRKGYFRTGGIARSIMPKPALSSGIHFFKRTFSLSSADVKSSAGGAIAFDPGNNVWVIQTPAAGPICSYHTMGVKFTLSQLQGIADFTSLFDAYKILKVKLKITPFSSGGSEVPDGTTRTNQPLSAMFFDILDRDDWNAPTASASGILEIQQYDTLKQRNFFNGRGHKRYFTPAIAQPAYATAIASGYVQSKPRWLDLSTTDVEHYGHKCIFQVFSPNITGSNYIWFKYEVTLYIACKGVR